MKVLRMKFSIVEIVPTPRESIFSIPRASQRAYGAKLMLLFVPYFLCLSGWGRAGIMFGRVPHGTSPHRWIDTKADRTGEPGARFGG